MPEANRIKWSLEADYFQACNCDYGCPCEFEAPPTPGYCEGLGAWKIKKGRYGNVSLDNLGFGFAAKWPGALHKGNGTAALFFDEKANPDQRNALMQIASGKAGGMPFEIIVTTFSKVLDPQYVPFKFEIKGKDSRVQIGRSVEMAFEAIKNPVTKSEESIRIEHGTGFIFKGADVVSAKVCKAQVGELDFSYPNKNGFVTKVNYAN